jgi:hypothetical protein
MVSQVDRIDDRRVNDEIEIARGVGNLKTILAGPAVPADDDT